MVSLSLSPPDSTTGGDQHIAARGFALEAVTDRIFNRLTEAGIPYCILRNRSLIPDGLMGWRDIDVLVPGRLSAKELVAILSPLVPAQIGQLRRGQITFFFPASDVYLRMDVFHGDLMWKSAPFIDHRRVLAERRDDTGYMVASPLHQAFIVLCSKLLWEGRLPARYESMVEAAAHQDPGGFRDLASRAFGKRLAYRLVDLALSGRVEEATPLAPACRRALWLRAIGRHPFGTPREFIAQITHGVRQRAHPSGLEVALLGPDGSGKTTVAAEIAGSPLRNVPFKKIVNRKGYRRTLPPLGSIAGFLLHRSIAPVGNALDPQGAPPHHPAVWFIKFMYYTLDRWIDQIPIRRELAHTSLVLRDRDLIELTVDARRYRYVGPSLLPRLIAKLQPRPGMVIVLDAPPEVLQSRKQEVTLEETARQRTAFRKLARSHPNGYIVNSDQPLPDVVGEVRQTINRFATSRTRTRYPGSTCEPAFWLHVGDDALTDPGVAGEVRYGDDI